MAVIRIEICSFKKTLNLNFCFILVSYLSKVATLPIENFPLCNCVLLQSCEAINTLIDNSPNDTYIKALIRNAVCRFDDTSIFVCCSNKFNYNKNVRGKKPKLDYLDELTGLNCPPSFGNEYDYDEYLTSHKVQPRYYEDHPYNVNYGFGGGENHHGYLNVLCEQFDNCSSLFFPHDEKHVNNYPSGRYPPYNHPDYHDHDHAHKSHVPFFPQSHTSNFYDFPTKIDTAITTSKVQSHCGSVPRISSRNPEVFPWITRLAYLNTSSRTIRYRCMGTIISDQHVLTAAHCVDQLVRELRLIYVRVGDDSRFDDYQIFETIVHPKFNEPLFNNDIALLKLAITSQSKGPLIKICLPQNNRNTLTIDTGIVAGWSSSDISALKAQTIRYINLTIMNNTECAIRYAKYSEHFETHIVITPTEFCAQAEAMNDVCEGDSGGPFMELSKSGYYTLLGIVAFGPKTNCGQSNLPGVYMRVGSYVAWIKKYI